MSDKIQIKGPVYLDSAHYNMPLESSWNASLVSGLRVLSNEIEEAKNIADIHDISVTRMDEMVDFGSYGDIGYAVPAKHNYVTSYYYVDFCITTDGDIDDDEIIIQNCCVQLTEGLARYLKELRSVSVLGTKYFVDDDDSAKFCLRAYFLASAGS